MRAEKKAENGLSFDIDNIYPLYANGSAVATYEEDLVYSPSVTYWTGWGGFFGGYCTTQSSNYATYTETNYFAADILDTVKVATGKNSSVIGYADYDVFGTPYQRGGTLREGNLMYGYTGKPVNTVTGLSDYGYRNYSSKLARFTTVDPIRDGNNWYTYVQNDPVNYVDLWGLRDIIAGNLVQDVDGKIRDTQTGNVKDVTEIVIDRPEGHTQGHYLSTLQIQTESSDGQIVSLYSNSVQSWVDKAVPATETDFTLPAGTYEGRLYGQTPSYQNPIGLINETLGVTFEIMALIHPNEITQGQGAEYAKLAATLVSAGYRFGNTDENYNYTGSITVVINDPVGITTTRDGKEIKKKKNK